MNNDLMDSASRIGMGMITHALAAMQHPDSRASVELVETADNMTHAEAAELAVFFSTLYATTLVDYIGDLEEAIEAHRDGCVALLAGE